MRSDKTTIPGAKKSISMEMTYAEAISIVTLSAVIGNGVLPSMVRAGPIKYMIPICHKLNMAKHRSFFVGCSNLFF